MSGRPQRRFEGLSIVAWSNLPFHERVVDRMANLLLDADDLLQMLMFEADRGKDVAWLDPGIGPTPTHPYEKLHIAGGNLVPQKSREANTIFAAGR